MINTLFGVVVPNIVMKWIGRSDYKSMKPQIDNVDEFKISEMNKMNFVD